MPTLHLGPKPAPPQRKSLERAQNVEQLFDQLLPCSWRGIIFPVTSLKVSFSEDLAEHKYYGVDGANVEVTGRSSMQIEATIPFVNGIAPGKNEKWGVLYPTVFREFVSTFGGSRTGVFQHPELGEINCKAHGLEFHHDPHRRDGVEVTARWTETNDPEDKRAALDNKSPITSGAVAAVNLDQSIDDLRGLAPEVPVFEETFGSLMNKVSAAFDTATALSNRFTNAPFLVLHRLKTVQDSAIRLRDARTWQFEDNCQRMRSAIEDYGNAITNKQAKKIGHYHTPSPMCLAAIAAAVGKTADEIIQLNPDLLKAPVIPSGVSVRYYK